VALVRHALAVPPERDAFEAMRPSERERRDFDNVVRLQREEPGSSLLAQLRAKIDGLEAVRVIFTEDRMITTTSNGTDATPYVVEDDLGDRVILLEGGDPNKRRVIAFDGDDDIVVTVGATRVPMSRVPDGVVPAPTSVAAGGATSSSLSSAPSPSGAASSDDPLVACIDDYYRCIEQMPAEAREASADLIEATKSVFARAQDSPASRDATLRSCRQAVDLARQTFCRDAR
jgi:hypothetical protein